MRASSRVPPLLAAVALSAAAAGCSGTPRIEIRGEKARLSPMFGGACSVFLEIANPGTADDALVEAAVDVPGAIAEVHDVRDGRMVRAPKVRIPASGLVDLRPGGLHIMIFNLPRDVRPGTELPLRLRFERSGERRTSVTIQG